MEVVTELKEYTKYHFDNEEAYEQYKYNKLLSRLPMMILLKNMDMIPKLLMETKGVIIGIVGFSN